VRVLALGVRRLGVGGVEGWRVEVVQVKVKGVVGRTH
jgi:hypothetical protein